MGGHDEREQTLNQILTEMDGFSGSEGVVVLAATNRADVLDPALTRPGRFDRIVQVSPPDRGGREAILKIHTRQIPLSEDVSLGQVARTTPGMTGADLANLANEAALLAVKRKKSEVNQADLSDALEKVQLGAERPLVMPEEERRRTAYHESGHALLGMLQPGADPVRKVTIVPRGRALGVTLSTPEADKYAYTEDYLRGRIIGALGGMAAEHLVYGVVTTGSESDLEQVTNLARGMVGRWGMSDRVGRLTAIRETPSRRTASRRRPPRWTRWTTRCGASSTSATSRRSGCCASTGRSWTRWRPRCCRTRRWTRRRPTGRRASRAWPSTESRPAERGTPFCGTPFQGAAPF